jgi:hypothetical protein
MGEGIKEVDPAKGQGKGFQERQPHVNNDQDLYHPSGSVAEILAGERRGLRAVEDLLGAGHEGEGGKDEDVDSNTSYPMCQGPPEQESRR